MPKHIQVCHQYIAHQDHADDPATCEAGKTEMASSTRAAVNRKFGKASSRNRANVFHQKKRKRLKTFSIILQCNNMIEQSTCIDMSKFEIEKDDDGNLQGDPWDSLVKSLPIYSEFANLIYFSDPPGFDVCCRGAVPTKDVT